MITNPIYGGTYAYGKTSVTVHYDGVMACPRSRRKPREEWLVHRFQIAESMDQATASIW